jgi:hypothetical protein
MQQLARIIRVVALPPYRLDLSFADGTSGVADLEPLLAGRMGVLKPLHTPEYFAQVRLDEEAGTVCWPNGADLDPDVLYAAAHGLSSPRPA